MELRSVDELMDLLHARRGGGGTPDRRRDGPARAPATCTDPHEHALRTAALLRRGRPADKELQVAGLVHALGQLLRPGDDTKHRTRPPTGTWPPTRSGRCSATGSHISYACTPSAPTTSYDSMRAAGWTTGLVEDVLTLRQADEAGRSAGMDAGVLEDWRTVLELVADRAHRTEGTSRPGRAGASSHHLPGA